MMSITDANFDNSLPILCGIIVENFGVDLLERGTFIRDGFGRLVFYHPENLPKKTMSNLKKVTAEALPNHTFPAGGVLDAQSPGAEAASRATKLEHVVSVNGRAMRIRLVDRRFFGRDWLTIPAPADATIPPVMAFSSLKGGVGRTTALFVLATALSRQGYNILIIDLDLEAPGLSVLIGDERPQFGVIDYLVESGLGKVSDADLNRFLATSNLTDRSADQGRVDVVPATGYQTTQHPQNMLAKLSRAMIENSSADGKSIPLAGKIEEFVSRISKNSSYDAILIDTRAGLSEITAAPLLSLGAQVLFFGTDQPHTFEGYRYLLSHLSTLPLKGAEDWRQKVHFVHAKAKSESAAAIEFTDKLYEVLSETFYEQDESEEVFNFSLDDDLAPHNPWRIFFNGQYIDFDPVQDNAILEEGVYEGAFGKFIVSAQEALGLNQELQGSCDEAAG